MTEREQLEQTIAALEAQRAMLGSAVVETALAPLREKLAALRAQSAAAQRKQVTVLFADISGFTAMMERIDPEEVGEIINALWVRVDTILITHGGTIDKHIGDAVMALFGAPTAHENDPERAIRAALAMQAEVGALVAEWGWHGGEGSPNTLLQMRVGINTGPVLVGAVGTTAEYTAIGDTVNLASRLEQAAPVGGILISHDTLRHVGGLFDVQPLAPLTVKGKAEPVQAYLVLAARPHGFQAAWRGAEGIKTRMVGRAPQLQRLHEMFQTVLATGSAQLATVVGEAGLGKSRLLNEFITAAPMASETIWLLKARCRLETSNLPYALVRDLFAYRFQIQDSDPAAVARQKLAQGIMALDSEDGEEKAHFIGHLLGLDFSTSPHLQGILSDARQIRDRAFRHIAHLLATVSAAPESGAGAARGTPVVMLLEDIHWADEGSLDLLEYLARTCADLPLLIVALARPALHERRPGWGASWQPHTRLDLRPLSDDDSLALAAEILGVIPPAAIPTELRQLLVGRAEGNPFYVEELIKMLKEDGVLVTGAGGWEIVPERLTAARVPATLTSVLQARLDRLAALERETLQRASVVGRTFWDETLAHLETAGREALPTSAAISQALMDLQGKEMVFERQESTFAGTHEYIFKHAILRDVVYESVLKRLRRTYHREVAGWLVKRSGERVGEYAGLIGEHYALAEEGALAAEWYERAASQALATYVPAVAIGYYQKALALLPPERAPAARLVACYVGLGEAFRWQARFEEARHAFEAMRAAAERGGERTAEARAWNYLSAVQSSRGDYRAASHSAIQAEALARSAGPAAHTELAQALRLQSAALYRLGGAAEALPLAEQALALASAHDARPEMAFCANLLGALNTMVGRHETATQCYERALALFREAGNRAGMLGPLTNLGELARVRGEYEAAVDRYEEALAMSRAIENRVGEMVSLVNLGGARVRLGAYEAAEQALRQVIQSAEEGGTQVSWIAATYCFLAEACLGQQRVGAALAAARQALGLGQSMGQQEYIALAWRILGLIAAESVAGLLPAETGAPAASPLDAAGQPPTRSASGCFAESERIFSAIGAESERARTLRAWARYELADGDRERGTAMWQEASSLFARLGLAREIEPMPQPSHPPCDSIVPGE